MGGSSGGARPKIFVAYNPHTNELIHGIGHVPDDFEDWIIKFPSSSDNSEMNSLITKWHCRQASK